MTPIQPTQEWQLDYATEVLLDATVERVWTALINAADTQHYFLGSRVTVDEVGRVFGLERDDGWHVDGVVLVKESPYKLRVTWQIETPPQVAMPSSEIEFIIERACCGRGTDDQVDNQFLH